MIFVAGWSGTVVLVSSKDPVLWSRPYFVEVVSWVIINKTTTKLVWIWHCKKTTKTTSHTKQKTQIHSKNKVEKPTLSKWPKEKFFPCSCTMVSNPDPLVPPAKLPAELATSRSKRATWSDRCERSKAWQPRHKTCLVHIPESRPCPLLELLPWAPSLHPQTTLNVQLSDIKFIHSRHFTPATAEILKLIDSKDPS